MRSWLPGDDLGGIDTPQSVPRGRRRLAQRIHLACDGRDRPRVGAEVHSFGGTGRESVRLTRTQGRTPGCPGVEAQHVLTMRRPCNSDVSRRREDLAVNDRKILDLVII